MKIHFVGIGGIGMSSLALHAHLSGYNVYGSDIYKSERTAFLKKIGIDVFIGHNERNWRDPDLLVRTPAAPLENPEISRAKREGVPVLTRSEFMKELVEEIPLQFAVTGTDGKTTTTAMITHVLMELGQKPTAFLGGVHKLFEYGNYQKGQNIVVYELDESQPEFCDFSPDYVIITNSRGDHLENFRNDKAFYRSCFEKLAANTKRGVVTFAEDEISGDLGTITFGVRKGDFHIEERCATSFGQSAVFKAFGKRYTLKLKVFGFHNALNALSVVAMLHHSGLKIEDIVSTLETFEGTERRFSVTPLAEDQNITLIDDYAHTPDEIKSLLQAAQEAFPNTYKVVVFQPHRYSRLLREDGNFARALINADEIYVTDVYSAFETGSRAVSSDVIVKGLAEAGKKAFYVPCVSDVANRLPIKPSTTYLFVGAGDITKASKMFTERFSSYILSK